MTCAPTDNVLRYTCTVDVDPAQPVELSFVRADGLSPARQVSSADALGEHLLPLHFMAPEVDYDVTAWATAFPDDSTSTTITTGALPAAVSTQLQMTGTSTMGLVGTNYPCSSDAVAVCSTPTPATSSGTS